MLKKRLNRSRRALHGERKRSTISAKMPLSASSTSVFLRRLGRPRQWIIRPNCLDKPRPSGWMRKSTAAQLVAIFHAKINVCTTHQFSKAKLKQPWKPLIWRQKLSPFSSSWTCWWRAKSYLFEPRPACNYSRAAFGRSDWIWIFCIDSEIALNTVASGNAQAPF